MGILARGITLVFLATVLTVGFPALGRADDPQAVTQEELAELYNKVRQAVSEVDVAAFEKLVIPPKPDAKKLTKEDLAEAKDFLDAIFPELAKVEMVKFDRNDTEALFVVRTDLEDKENISLSSFRFRKKDGVWMLWAKFSGKSFSAQNPAADEKEIKKTLDHNPDFKLLSKEEKAAQEQGSAQAQAAPAGQTGSGSLTVAGQTYNFGHAFAFRKKALGYDDKINIHVVLTEKAVSVEGIKAQLKEKDDWSQFVNNLVLVFDPEMNPEFASFWVKHESTNFSGPPFYAQGEARVEGERIKGRLKMEKPKKLFGDTFIYDVAFDAPIISK